MASRKKCDSCKKSFGKTAYYDHLPCKFQLEKHQEKQKIADYVFCGHCNTKVARKTYYEHQNLQKKNYEGIIFDETSHASNVVNSPLDVEHVRYEDGDVEYLTDEEEQVFYSDSDEPDSDNIRESALPNNTDDHENDSDPSVSDPSDSEEFEHYDDDEEDYQGQPNTSMSSESRLLILFILLWQTIYKVSDRGITVILVFFKSFLMMIGNVFNSAVLIKFAETLPKSIYLAKARLGLENDEFDKFVVCPRCMTLYNVDDCTVRRSTGKIVSRRCTHVNFPNHPQKSRRKECGTLLMKTMRSKTGNFFLHPKKVYCFRKLSSSLKSMLARPGFLEKCEQWRERKHTPGSMGDVFEGNLWKEFLDKDGRKFFAQPGNLGVMLNVDWFQPYKHTSHSCGVLYLVLMNLPREERFKFENVLIVGIIPGPEEPKGNVNSFLQPLVSELTELWDGMIFENTCLGMYNIRVALLALCCDVPAARKCGGFAGHSARKGCNKCFKTFSTGAFGSKPDFSGFDKEQWEKRTNELHRIHAETTLGETTPAQLKNMVWKTGAKYTALLQLPYYDAVRFVVIDPMHNLFLGVAKHMLKLWSKEGLLNDKDFKILQKRTDAVTPPPEIGRIPSKIATGFSGFTADQWKNWVCYYSVFALKGILASKHYNVWLHFVNACRLICSKCITSEECKQAEANILEFCKSAEKLYGKEMCTPNMHLSCHLVDCIMDYGPVYSFWCFSFERYNGILGSYHMNNHNISIQLMRKFLRDNELLQIQFPEEHSQFKELLSVSHTGTVGEVNTPFHDIDNLKVIPHPPIKRVGLNEEGAFHMTAMYQDLYLNSQINVLRLCDSYSRAQIGGRIIRCTNNGCVYAQFKDGEERPCKVKRFLNHEVVIKRDGKRKKVSHVIAEVQWLQRHPERNWCPSPVQVWSVNFEPYGMPSFIPVTEFICQCIVSNYKVKFSHGRENVNIVIPLIGNF